MFRGSGRKRKLGGKKLHKVLGWKGEVCSLEWGRGKCNWIWKVTEAKVETKIWVGKWLFRVLSETVYI